MKFFLSSKINLIIILLFAIFCIIISCDNNKQGITINEELEIPSTQNSEDILLAKAYCGSCHLYVPPEILPKEYWKVVLTKMSRYMGFNRAGDSYYGHTAVALSRLDSAKIFPTEQIITNEDWQKVVLFYLNGSPDSLDLGRRPEIDFGLKQFEVKTIPWLTPLQGPTFIKMLNNKNIAVGFSQMQDINELNIIDLNGNVLLTRKIPAALTSISQDGNDMYMTFMGLFDADDTPTGSIGKVEVDRDLQPVEPMKIILNKRERPVSVNAIDVNQDLRTDLIVTEFGKFLGGLNLYLQDKSGGYIKKTLLNVPGATSTIIRDVNNDGLPDFYSLISQGNEGIYLFTNKGGGDFETNIIKQFPPYYGTVFMDLIDFDQDGLEDIILSNGDSGDFGNPEKPFHGIRLFKNKDNQVFEEEWFYPQQGAYKSLAMDFDLDGDLDIASIGFFAYGTSLPEEGFLYLENLGVENNKVQFKTYSFVDASNSSFLVMDAGDIDNDGDLDLILGASTTLMSVDEMVGQLLKWQSSGGAVVLLENTLY